MAIPQQQKPLFQEGRLILALNAYKQGQFSNLQSVVKIYSLVGWPGGLHGPLTCRLRYNITLLEKYIRYSSKIRLRSNTYYIPLII